MLQQEPPKKKLIGVVELDSIKIFPVLESILYKNMIEDISTKEYQLIPIKPDSSAILDSLDRQILVYSLMLDSLNNQLEEILSYRQRIFKSKRIRRSTKKRLLEKSFSQLQAIKTEMKSIDSVYRQIKLQKMNLVNRQLRRKADSLLNKNVINIYLVFSNHSLAEGNVEYHAYNAGEFLDTQVLDKSISQALLHLKLLGLRLNEKDIQFILNPFEKKEFWVVQQRKEPFNIVGGYVVPVFLALLTVISLILNSETFFLRILNDKSQKLFELMYYKQSALTWIFLRIFPALIGSLIQIILWIGFVFVSYKLNIIHMKEFFLFKEQNLIYFLIEYIMAFLFLTIIYFMLFPFINVSESRYSFIIQFFRIVLFIPIIFAFVFIRNLYPPLKTVATALPFYLPTMHLIYIDFKLYIGKQTVILNAVIVMIGFILLGALIFYLKRLKFEWMISDFKLTETFSILKFISTKNKRFTSQKK
jgi:hypothetical protein